MTPGQHASIPNPFSASGVSSLRNFQMPASGSVHSGRSGMSEMGNFQSSVKSAVELTNTAKSSELSGQINSLRSVVKIPPYQQIVSPGVRLQAKLKYRILSW